jgi:hypothetical protein
VLSLHSEFLKSLNVIINAIINAIIVCIVITKNEIEKREKEFSTRISQTKVMQVACIL